MKYTKKQRNEIYKKAYDVALEWDGYVFICHAISGCLEIHFFSV